MGHKSHNTVINETQNTQNINNIVNDQYVTNEHNAYDHVAVNNVY